MFKDLGKLKSIYKITIEDHAKPFSIATLRRLPLPMRRKVEGELKRMEEEDVIRPVKNPTEWCALIVVVPNSNGKVRICVELTKLNESVRRENFLHNSRVPKCSANLTATADFIKSHCMRSLRN